MNSDDIDRGPKRQLEHKCGRARARRKPAYELRPGIGKELHGLDTAKRSAANSVTMGNFLQDATRRFLWLLSGRSWR